MKKLSTILLCLAVIFTFSFSSVFADTKLVTSNTNPYQNIDRITVYDAEEIENELVQSELDTGIIKISSKRVTYKT